MADGESTFGTTPAAAAVETTANLNVNASTFVPRCHAVNNNIKAPSLIDVDVLIERKPRPPTLVLPWKGFPKPLQPERPVRPPKDQKPLLEQPIVKPVPEPNEQMTIPKVEVQDEKRRKVALEALKLVEQRRLREAEKMAEPIIHLTREPVNYNAEERVRVDRLRIIKRERIERVLREMQEEKAHGLKEEKAEGEKELKPKPSKVDHIRVRPSSRYICLYRAVKPENQEQQPQQQLEPSESEELAEKSDPPKRYIPTAKQWEERCRANKENSKAKMPYGKLDENATVPPSSQGNIMKPRKPPSSGAKELFVPRYRPPMPPIAPPAEGEQRRGNLTYARGISHGLLPTPKLPSLWQGATIAKEAINDESGKPVRRYSVEELLKWEPQPNELVKPVFRPELLKLSFIAN